MKSNIHGSLCVLFQETIAKLTPLRASSSCCMITVSSISSLTEADPAHGPPVREANLCSFCNIHCILHGYQGANIQRVEPPKEAQPAAIQMSSRGALLKSAPETATPLHPHPKKGWLQQHHRPALWSGSMPKVASTEYGPTLHSKSRQRAAS